MSAANEIIYAKMAYSPNLGRRKSIAALGAVLAGAALGAAAGSPADAGPDDALIAACAEFEALEAQMGAMFPGGAAPIPDDGERQAEMAPLLARQEDLVDVIFDAKAFTQAGHQARARAAIAFQPDLLNPEFGFDDNGAVILSALLRDLTAA